jgi:selenide,water dikinase
MPIDKMPPEMVREILRGGTEVCATAGIPVGGGHSIDTPEPIYGLAVIGTCHPSQVRRNASAKAGDALILTKALGVGIYSAAIKKEALSSEGYDEMIATTTLLNKIGAELAQDTSVHAMTDVTGFGLLGHGLEVARGSNLSLQISLDAIAFLSQAAKLAQDGFVTGASHRNWTSYGNEVVLPADLPDWQRHLLTDPQTSGGLLVACAADQAPRVLEQIIAAGYPSARHIGQALEDPAQEGPAQIVIIA